LEGRELRKGSDWEKMVLNLPMAKDYLKQEEVMNREDNVKFNISEMEKLYQRQDTRYRPRVEVRLLQ
jgi:hypothetical protein